MFADSYLFFIYFFAGIVTFFASCTFILVPPFLGVIGKSFGSQSDGKDKRILILKNSLLYILGFSAVFVILGVGLGFASKVLFFREIMQRVGGVVLVILGVTMLGFFKHSFFARNISFRLPQYFLRSGGISSLFLGGIFAIGWSPCTSPMLGSILILTSYASTMFKGVLFLLSFSLGIALPFLFAALFFGQLHKFFEKSEKFNRGISMFSAVFLIAIGLLITSGKFYTVAEYFLF